MLLYNLPQENRKNKHQLMTNAYLIKKKNFLPYQICYIGSIVNMLSLTTELVVTDANGKPVQLPVVSEKAVNIFFNNQKM